MRVTSTEFQQKVGYYLDLADQGEKIEIEKQKPEKKIYELKSKKDSFVEDAPKENRWQKLINHIESEGGADLDFKGNSVDFVRKVRS